MIDLLVNPGLLLIAGGLLLPVLPRALHGLWMLGLPVAGFALLCILGSGAHGQLDIAGLSLTTVHVDTLAFVFAAVFHLAALLLGIYALHVRDRLQHAAALVYAGAGVAAVLAGDLVTLFVYWELTALASVFLIWARRTDRAYRVGLRYLLIQVGSGLLLMAGIILRYRATGNLAVEHIGLDSPGGWLMFLGIGIKCAFPLLHNWLQDAYPEATVTGSVVLSVFTTKLAIYALIRGFAGTDLLIPIGAAMTLFPIFFAVIENDMRRVLAYSINNQIGFMVVGIGVGTELAIDGAVAHAVAEILFKGLLFMAMGAVFYRVGTIKASELGGLYKSMPVTAVLCIVGSASISAFPLFSGFVTKSMIMTATAGEGYWLVWVVMLVASAGVLDHAGIKIPFFSFFHRDAGHRVREAPWNMLLAMGASAALCIGIGVWPAPLYALLPYAVDYSPYTVAHVVTQLQLLLFAVLAFTVLLRHGWYPAEVPAVNLDSDWVYRRLLPRLMGTGQRTLIALRGHAQRSLTRGGRRGAAWLASLYAPAGLLARTWGTGVMTFWVALLLAAYLLLYY
ncbi:MAG: Na(+)/H(+) antiporter subunit D [Salinisphaera sp.]|nr:Na(+)/H(+) antiporter subunit D [Salinisphaera sp.]